MIDIVEVDSTPAVDQLTAEDIAALRMAESVTFHHYDGQSVIRVQIRGHGEPVIFTARQQRLFPKPGTFDSERMREIACDHSINSYQGIREPRTTQCFTGFLSLPPAHWHTIAGSLRKGETIELQWVGSNNNQYEDDAGLHHDALYLKAGQRVYLVDTSVCPDNTARMIRQC